MRILVVEDEIELARLIRRALERERIDIELAHTGDKGLEKALTGTFDGIILDRMLPGMDGLSICYELRLAGVNTPVLILSALRDLDRRVEGLENGADDYLGKPFAFEELIARVHALTRRASQRYLPDVLAVGSVAMHIHRRSVSVGGRAVELTPTEFSLLEFLLRNADQALTRDQILEHVWGYDADPEGNVVDLYIHYLRRKLQVDGPGSPIETVRGVGYRLRAD